MLITGCIRFLMLCALLSLLPPGGALADPAIKSAIGGLISTGSPTNVLTVFNNPKKNIDVTGIFGGLVIQATWADLEPSQPATPDGLAALDTGYISQIDTALQAVGTYNTAAAKLKAPNNRQIGVRLRVFSGCSAPTWAKSLGGSPIATSHVITNLSGKGKTETCSLGRFWIDNPPQMGFTYAKAWAQLQRSLGAIYDANPLIHEVAVTSCTTYTAEPFYLPNDDTVTQPLVQAGYSDASYQRCLENAVADYAPWQTTRLEFTFNPFHGLTPPASSIADVAFSDRVMHGCRQAVGQRCILSNHDLDTNPPTAGGMLALYALLRKFGPNVTFQTYVKTPKDFEGTLRKGISLGAGSIEVWPDGYEAQSNATLENWAEMFVPQ